MMIMMQVIIIIIIIIITPPHPPPIQRFALIHMKALCDTPPVESSACCKLITAIHNIGRREGNNGTHSFETLT